MVIGKTKTNVIAGIVAMLVAMFIFASLNALVKHLSGTYSIWQIVFFRFAFGIIPTSIMILMDSKGSKQMPTAKPSPLVMNNPVVVIGIGVLAAFAIYVLFQAFKIGRLADVTALAYSSIIFLTILSVPLLKEKVGWRRWAAVVVGFSGILLMASPDTNIQLGSLLGIGFAFLDAILMILIRIATKNNRTSTIAFYTSVTAALVAFPFVITDFQMPATSIDLMILMFLGIGGGIGQIFLTRSYSLAPAVAVAPMIYTSMIWGAIYGVVLFGESITLHLVTGAVIVVLSSLYIMYREHIEHKNPASDLLID